MSKRVLAGLVAMLALPAQAANDPPAAPAFEPADCAALNFKPSDLDAGVKCGWLTVPETRAKQGRQIRLAVVIARSTSKADARAPVLYLHGGPGIATLDVVPRALRGKSWPLLREQHDLIFFDQRGTGRSTPAICADFNQAMVELAKKGLGPAAESAAKIAAARTCRDQLGALGVNPESYSSTEIAADAEAIRQALGISRWNIFATSFGSLPAAELIRHWPATVRALILDSAFPPNSANRAEQISATADSFNALQHRCDSLSDCRGQFPNFRQSAAAIGKRLDAAPLTGSNGPITGENFSSALWTLMVDGSTVAYLPELLSRAAAGDDELIRQFTGVFDDSAYFGGYAAAQAWLVNCHDIFPRPSRQLVAKAGRENPDLAARVDSHEQDAVCDILQPSHADAGFFRPLEKPVPTLILFGEFDPATPLTDARTARAFFGNATLVEVKGASHAPFYTDACTKGIAVNFLAAPEGPIDQSCLAVRKPFAFANAAEFKDFMLSLAK